MSTNKPIKVPPPVGYIEPGFEQVLEAFRESFSKGMDRGASFAAYYQGRPVVNLWGGLADEQVKRAWKEETMGLFHSTTKFMAAVTIAHMVERGFLSYDEKIATYWPEFACNGKENITLKTLLSYRAGLSVLEENFQLGWIREDPQRLSDQLAKQKPLWEPGLCEEVYKISEAHGYHPLTMGLYLDQIVQRADKKKRSVSQYFHEEIAVPFGIDFYIGLPYALQYRAARLEPRIPDKEDTAKKMRDFEGDHYIFKLSLTQPRDWFSSRRLNDPDFMSLPCASSHGVGTALAVAKFAGILANGGQHKGKTLLSQESIDRLQEPMSHGRDMTSSGTDVYGMGTMLNPVMEGGEHWFMFGHSGFGDQNGVADSKYKVGWAYTTNYTDPMVSYHGKHKWRPLVKALYECIHKKENVHLKMKILKSYEDFVMEKYKQEQRSKL